jgi:four helix bundle protein
MKRVPSKNFKDLIVWQKSHQLVLNIFKYSDEFSKTKIFGLNSQLRRLIISVSANIAEGFKKRGKPDKMRYMNIALGSLEESRYYLIITKDLKYGDNNHLINHVKEVSKL